MAGWDMHSGERVFCFKNDKGANAKQGLTDKAQESQEGGGHETQKDKGDGKVQLKNG
jgi:hypothetical protein